MSHLDLGWIYAGANLADLGQSFAACHSHLLDRQDRKRLRVLATGRFMAAQFTSSEQPFGSDNRMSVGLLQLVLQE